MLPECTRRAHTYWTTCSCPDCVLERRRKHKLYSMGRPYRIPAEPAAAMLAERIDQGWTGRALASAAGLRLNYFHRHVTARKRGEDLPHLGPNIAAAILGMGDPTDGHLGALGTRRRLRALAAIGHPLEAVAAESGVNFSTLGMIRNGATERVHARVFLAVRATYERMEMTVGANQRVRRDAVAKGWLPPMAYDRIDDPAERPRSPKPETAQNETVDHAVVQRVISGEKKPRKLTHAEATLIAQGLVARGVSPARMESDYGLKPERYLGGAA